MKKRINMIKRIFVISRTDYDNNRSDIHTFLIHNKCYPDRLINYNVVILPLSNSKKKINAIRTKLRELDINYELCILKR